MDTSNEAANHSAPEIEDAHFNILQAIRTVNLMSQLGPNNTFNQRKAELEDKLYAPDQENMSMFAISETSNFDSRDRFDARGKVLCCLMAKAMEVSDDQLVVDPAQAGCLLGTSDAAIVDKSGNLVPIEIKGTKSKKGKRGTFFVNGIRLSGTDWKHLFIVARTEDPDIWTDVSEYGKRGFWLGHVTRRNLIRAAAASGRYELRTLDATVTPGSKRSWLGQHIDWVRAQDLSSDWWDAKVLRAQQ